MELRLCLWRWRGIGEYVCLVVIVWVVDHRQGGCRRRAAARHNARDDTSVSVDHGRETN